MQIANTRLDTLDRFRFFWLPLTIAVALFLTVTIWVRVSLGQGRQQSTYASPEEASQALCEAAQNDNEQAILQILGGHKELVFSGDPQDDKAARRQFAAKFKEIHRFVRQLDGTWVLYIGAENWPFPVPLVREKEKWFFDADAGTQEILFRRIGDNESAAIQVCHALTRVIMENHLESTSDDVVTQYALNLVHAKRVDGSHGLADHFHGYYFLRVSDDPDMANGAVLLVAYPVKYRFSGVMTFVVTSDDVVFQKDLGPNTPRLARALDKNTPDLSWEVAE
ncbi:MAG TPA: DUF2950 family protein [Terriglobales bacterium]|jgi:hypothetical protein|nr:DUF2950 family protein [Terriglobales bacterium]